jgi:hypothetical protein
MPSIASRGKLWIFLLFFIIFFSGCKEKVYWISGGPDKPVLDCSKFPGIADLYVEAIEINHLFKLASQTEDLDQLRTISNQIHAVVVEFEKYIKPEFTDSRYPVRYLWSVPKVYLITADQLIPVALGFKGVELQKNDLQIQEFPDRLEISLARTASAVEICTFAPSLQALVSVNKPNGNVRYYYRLGIESTQN